MVARWAAAAAFVLVLSGCGGGGGNPGACLRSDEVCGVNQPAPASPQPATTSVPVTQVCGYEVGAGLLLGQITEVVDGDTVTLSAGSGTQRVRLEGIDAPEMDQPFGAESKAVLSALLLGRTVRVAYSKSDRYSRVLGSVFTDGCEYANLNQVATGMAWFYRTYQCEMSASLRARFAAAETTARNAKLGVGAAESGGTLDSQKRPRPSSACMHLRFANVLG